MQKVDHLRLRVALTRVGAPALTLTPIGLVWLSPQACGLVESFIRSH